MRRGWNSGFGCLKLRSTREGMGSRVSCLVFRVLVLGFGFGSRAQGLVYIGFTVCLRVLRLA